MDPLILELAQIPPGPADIPRTSREDSSVTGRSGLAPAPARPARAAAVSGAGWSRLGRVFSAVIAGRNVHRSSVTWCLRGEATCTGDGESVSGFP